MEFVINSKSDLDNLVRNIIENNLEINENIANIIKQKLIELLQKGEIPESFWVELYFKLKDFSFTQNEFIEKNLEMLENYYNDASIDEKLLINNVIFILEIFESKVNTKKYIKRIMYQNIYQIKDNNNFKIFRNFIKKIEDKELLIDIVRELIHEIKELDEETATNIYGNLIVIMWNVPIMMNNKIWLEVFDDLVDLLNFFIKNNKIELQMKYHFFTYHIYGNNIQTIDKWRVFNEKVEKPASIFYKAWGKKNNLKKAKKTISNSKKKIGIIFDRIVMNSPFMVTFSFLKALMNNEEFKKEYEIIVYSMCYAEKQTDDGSLINLIISLGINVVSACATFVEYGILYPHLQKALYLREKIIEDKIDYLISGFGYDIPNFIFSTRSAPVQILWSHGNCTTDIEGIDKRISHFSQECGEFEWKIFDVPIAKEFLVGSEDDKQKGLTLKKSLLETFGKDTVILGTIGRLIKIDSDEYLKVISEIMKENPNTIYLACGGGNEKSIKEKLKKYDIDENRFIFTGQINPHVFGWVIDVWPDSFPLGQGQSKDEFIAKGKPVIFHTKRNIAIDENNKIFVANNDEVFISIVSNVIKNKKLREKISSLQKKLWFERDFTLNFLK